MRRRARAGRPLVADLAAETADLTAMLRPLAPADWDAADPGRRLGHPGPGQPPGLLRRDTPAVAATDPARVHGRGGRADRGRDDFTERVAGAAPRTCPAAELLDWFASARAGTWRVPTGLPTRRAAALVRAGHERRLLGHRPADGDLGARPGHRRRARASPGRPPARLRHIATSACATMALQLRRPRPAGPGDAGPGRAGRARTARLDLGPAGRGRTGSRATALDFCLLVTQRRQPADTGAARHRPGRGRLAGASPRRSPARPGRPRAARRQRPAGDEPRPPAPGARMSTPAGPDRQLLRLLRRPAGRRPGDGRGRTRSTC